MITRNSILSDEKQLGIRRRNTYQKLYMRKEECCGCSACVTACPVQCISLELDEEGFYYPILNGNKCIECDRCTEVCPIQNITQEQRTEKNCYVGYSKNKTIRFNSSSGGIFTELAESVLGVNGYVFGAAFDKKYQVVHQMVSDLSKLDALRGSKYVQSSIGDAYEKVEKLLLRGKQVYFSGTPCQVKALKLYLGNLNNKNLYTQDVICHGVPSPKIWKDYVESRSSKQIIRKISFRSKKYGWHYFAMLIQGEKKNYCKRLDEDWYLRLFLDNTILRPVCYECPLKKEGSWADLTLADCWNPNKVSEEIKDTDEGLSLIFINTSKGNDLWTSIIKSNRVVYEMVNSQKAMGSQAAICHSVKPNIRRTEFFEEYNQKGFDSVLKGWYRERRYKKLWRHFVFYKTRLYMLFRRLGIKL